MFDITKVNNIHFVGIGGIGMSALARMFVLIGKTVAGSDTAHSRTTEELEKLGVKIFYGQRKENISSETDLVVYTIAISEDDPERVEAKKRGILYLSYPELLGEVSKGKFTIAVSGTHGKTTTTGMIAKILLDAGKDPTVVIGSFLSGYDSNFIAGKSDLFVVEACEYKRSFLNLNPNIIVITNIDADHLDYYRDVEEIRAAFSEFADRLSPESTLISVSGLISEKNRNFIDYEKEKKTIPLLVPGEHNQKNARAALAVAQALNIPKKKALKSLSEFKGTWRRFEYKGKTKKGVLVYDDYAHHPTEIKATISGFRKLFPERKLVIAFQPHLFSRTKALLDEFGKALSCADEILLAPIYAAREAHNPSVSSELLAQKVHVPVKAFPSLKEVANYSLHMYKNKEVFVTMGAGDIYEVGNTILQKQSFGHF